MLLTIHASTAGGAEAHGLRAALVVLVELKGLVSLLPETLESCVSSNSTVRIWNIFPEI